MTRRTRDRAADRTAIRQHTRSPGALPEVRPTPDGAGRGPTPAAPVGKARLEALCDGVFAIVMTLLVLELLPHDLPPGMGDAALRALLAGLWPKVVSYVISFVVVAIFWVGHHAEFAHIRRTDRRHVWINVALLLAVSFIPFSAALLGAEYEAPLAVQVYGVNLTVAALALAANWAYATAGRRLTDAALSAAVVRRFARRLAVGPAVYVAAVLVGARSPRTSFALYVAAAALYIALQVGPAEPPHAEA